MKGLLRVSIEVFRKNHLAGWFFRIWRLCYYNDPTPTSEDRYIQNYSDLSKTLYFIKFMRQAPPTLQNLRFSSGVKKRSLFMPGESQTSGKAAEQDHCGQLRASASDEVKRPAIRVGEPPNMTSPSAGKSPQTRYLVGA